MKKKFLIPILLMILLTVAVLGYLTFKKSDIPQNGKQSITASESQKEVTSEESFISYSSGFEITNLKESYVYTGEPIDLAVDIINNGAGFDETFLLYINGRQNSYRTDTDDEKSCIILSLYPKIKQLVFIYSLNPKTAKKEIKFRLRLFA